MSEDFFRINNQDNKTIIEYLVKLTVTTLQQCDKIYSKLMKSKLQHVKIC